MYDDAYKQRGGASAPAPDPQQQIANTRLAVRETLLLAADRVGGVDALEKWIRSSTDNERIFWSAIWPRLLAIEAAMAAGEEPGLDVTAARWLPYQ